MSRSSRRRVSRTIAVVLICVLGAGAYVTVKKLRHRTPAAPQPVAANTDKPAAGPQTPAISPAVAETPLPAPLLAISRTPTTMPSAAIAAPAAPAPAGADSSAAAAPATAPVDGGAALSGNPLTDGRAKLEAGDPIGARTILNEALLSGRLSAEDAAAAKAMIAKISLDVVFGRRVYPNDPFSVNYSLRPGEVLQKVAASNGTTWELIARINAVADPRRVRAGQALKIIKGPFHAVVTKSAFTLDLYLGSPGEAGSVFVTSFPVGLGKDSSTPTGLWQAGTKLRNPDYYSPRGEGIIPSNDPRNPLGKLWIGLTGVDGHAMGKMSYGIHGTIDPSSIGKEASMGCIRMRNEDVELVYEMLVEGKSRVVVKD